MYVCINGSIANEIYIVFIIKEVLIYIDISGQGWIHHQG